MSNVGLQRGLRRENMIWNPIENHSIPAVILGLEGRYK